MEGLDADFGHLDASDASPAIQDVEGRIAGKHFL
jgi:hypothetical protein